MSKLYNNAKDPSKKTLGTGYGSKIKAEKTLKIIKKLPDVKQKQIVITMFNRAKFHKYRTKDMEAAMKIFSKWMDAKKIRYSIKKPKTMKNKNSKKQKSRKNKMIVNTCSNKGAIEPPCKYGSRKRALVNKSIFYSSKY